MNLNSVVQKLEANRVSSVSGLTFESCLFFLEGFAGPVCVLGSYDYVERASVFFQEKIGFGVGCVLPPQKGAVGLINQHYFSSSVSIQMLATKPQDVRLMFIEEGEAKKPLFPVKKTSPFIAFDKTSFDDLLEGLSLAGFSHSKDSLSPGTFLIQGGTIDVFLFNINQVYRVSFLEGATRIFIVNKQNNKIGGEVEELKIYPKIKKNKGSFFDVFSSLFQVYRYNNGALYHTQKTAQTKNIDLGCIPFDYQDFIKNKPSKNFVFLDSLCEKGFIYKKTKYLPSWFNKDETLSFDVGAHPDVFGPLRIGGTYIHDNFGFCSFLGLETTQKGEKICLKFADGSVKLDISYISKLSFVSLERKKLSFLNKTAAWKRQKGTVEKRAEEFVGSLVSSYLKREDSPSVKMDVSDELIVDFVREFPYKDTPDQLLCWHNILKDLGSSSPMNRLVCGDVGFGKTELAIRASFVASINGSSVAIVAPTTLLANQLYHCFVSRLNPFGVTVGCFSRATTNKKRVLFDFLSGKINVLVGTSAVLFQEDILSFCGLFIIDEEHRFGVESKERVFKYNPGVNFLSLSATPIPRSMQLSLSGVRNFSLIQTPPVARKPIISSLNYFSKDLIKNIIIKEISRGGQVYFVDNSVKNLKSSFQKIKTLLPSFSLDVVYGTLDSNSLIKKMDLFVKGKTQVLFSTTIIESGIDIGATNTIIVNNAHLFGLSQLYQLRGRVGRSSVQAFAWFLFPEKKTITTDGVSRLKTILKHSSLGEGYQVALSDLEIRGAGSLFGYHQSGGGGVGFEYYSKVLASVAYKINQNKPKECFVDLYNPSIPVSFLSKEEDRVFYYKKIFSCKNLNDLKKTKQHIIDVFGVCVKEVEVLINNKKLSFLAAEKNISRVSRSKDIVSVYFTIEKKDPCVDVVVSYIIDFFTKTGLRFWFIQSHKNLIFKYKNVEKDDYILLLSFIKKMSFF